MRRKERKKEDEIAEGLEEYYREVEESEEKKKLKENKETSLSVAVKRRRKAKAKFVEFWIERNNPVACKKCEYKNTKDCALVFPMVEECNLIKKRLISLSNFFSEIQKFRIESIND